MMSPMAVAKKEPAWSVKERIWTAINIPVWFLLCLTIYMPDDFIGKLGLPERWWRPAWD